MKNMKCLKKLNNIMKPTNLNILTQSNKVVNSIEFLKCVCNRKMVVISPLKLTITNYPKNKIEQIKSENNPEQESAGFRDIPFSRHLYIEKEDFKEEAGRKFFRLTVGKEVRLKSAYIIKAEKAIKNNKGEIEEVLCVYDNKSKSGSGTKESQRKVKGTLHWVSQDHGLPVEIRDYDRLFLTPTPGDETRDFLKDINPRCVIYYFSFNVLSKKFGYIREYVECPHRVI